MTDQEKAAVSQAYKMSSKEAFRAAFRAGFEAGARAMKAAQDRAARAEADSHDGFCYDGAAWAVMEAVLGVPLPECSDG